jgi:SAM-dependent methyltransferase
MSMRANTARSWHPARVEEHLYPQLYALEESHWWFRGRRAVLRALVDRADPPRPARILDAGCGTGRNLVEFGDRGPAVGVDPSAQAVAFCRQRGLEGVTQATLESLPFEDGSFDLLFAFDVIEHIEDDERALRELRRVAAPGARLVVTVPAYSWLWSAHDEEHHHVRRYTLRRLRERAAVAGWETTFATYFNSILLPPIALLRALPRRNGRSDLELVPPALNRALEQPLRLEARAISRGARLPAGVSAATVLRPLS